MDMWCPHYVAGWAVSLGIGREETPKSGINSGKAAGILKQYYPVGRFQTYFHNSLWTCEGSKITKANLRPIGKEVCLKTCRDLQRVTTGPSKAFPLFSRL